MYRFIEDQSQPFPVQLLCQTLQVSRSRYYEWLKPVTTPTSTGRSRVRVEYRPTEGQKAHNSQQIKELFILHRRRYGTRRLVVEMKDRGVKVSRELVRNVLATNGLKPIQPRSFVRQRPTVAYHR